MLLFFDLFLGLESIAQFKEDMVVIKTIFLKHKRSVAFQTNTRLSIHIIIIFMGKYSNVNPDMFELLNMTKHMVMSIKQQIGKSA